MNNEPKSFNSDTRFDLRVNDNTTSSLLQTYEARNNARTAAQEFAQGNGELAYTAGLKEAIDLLQKKEKLETNEANRLQRLLKLQSDINKQIDSQYPSLEKVSKINEDIVKELQKAAKAQATIALKSAQTREERDRINDNLADELQKYDDLLDKAKELQESTKNASKSFLKSFSEDLGKVKSEIKDLAIVKSLGDISQGLFGNGTTSMASVYNSTRSQFGVTASQFDSFKNSLTKQLITTGNIFEFGWKDTAEYMSKLGDLGITSQEMARQQYLSVMQGTKYLGLQTDTQEKILRISRNTGNVSLLKSTNEAIVQILNAQLGISKEQLNTMTNQAAEVTNMTDFLGTGGESLPDLLKMQAAISKEYGQATGTAAMNILQDIINNPTGSQYLTNGYIAGSYHNILRAINSGNTDEALKMIVESVRSSNVTDVAKGNIINANALGADNNIMAISSATGSMNGVNSHLRTINESSKDISETIKEFNKNWSTKLLNIGSNILSLLPFSEVLNLQNIYYGLALVQLLVKIPSTLKVMTGILSQIATNTGMSAANFNPESGTGLGGLLKGNIGKISAIAAGVASLAMFINDAAQGSSKADDWGTSKTSAAIGGLIGGTDRGDVERTVKNAGKYALAGTALGFLFGPAGSAVGAVVGGLIGLAIGGATGAVGGERIAKFLDGKKSYDSTGDALAPVVSAPGIGDSGMGEPISSGNFPWRLTSKYGYRGVIQTSKGPTNPFHRGIDLASKSGTPIGANNAGIVSAAGTANDGANYVIINSGNGYEQLYWHLQKPSHLRKGDRVNEGQLIGYMGMTGHATGPHLHFGLRRAGTQNYMDPINSMNSGTFYPTDNGYTQVQIDQDKESNVLLEKVISADTLSNKVAAIAYDGVGTGDVVNAVNNGFSGLSNKLEELSNRQNSQEQVLKQLTSRTSPKVYQY